jgi:hypothetical protein
MLAEAEERSAEHKGAERRSEAEERSAEHKGAERRSRNDAQQSGRVGSRSSRAPPRDGDVL